MVTGSVARRYAKALFGLAVEANRVEAWADALEGLGQVLAGAPDIAEALGHRAYAREERRAIVEQLSAALKLEPAPANLLLLLGDRNRLDQLAQVVQAFTALTDAHLGKVRAKLTSAVPLDSTSLEAIGARLDRAAGGKVIIEREVDPSLLGGVVAQMGNLVFDGSLRSQLEDLRTTLKR